jgi:hypothetical protein
MDQNPNKYKDTKPKMSAFLAVFGSAQTNTGFSNTGRYIRVPNFRSLKQTQKIQNSETASQIYGTGVGGWLCICDSGNLLLDSGSTN